MNNIFTFSVALKGVSSVWQNNTQIGVCLTSSSSVLIGEYIPFEEIFVIDNKGEKPLSEDDLKTITEIKTDVYKINPEHERFMLLDADKEEYIGERIIYLLYLPHREKFLVTGISYSIKNPENYI